MITLFPFRPLLSILLKFLVSWMPLFFLLLPFFLTITTWVSPTWAYSGEKKKLRWGSDIESGAPYAMRDPSHPDVLIGFEVEMIRALARELEMEPLFVQNQWDGLIAGLQSNRYDIVISGLEITEDREEEIDFSDPYYITYEQLVVAKNTYDIYSLSDLDGKKVGTHNGTLAQRILEQAKGVETKIYTGEQNLYADLANERIQAVLLDAPIAIYYAAPNPKLKLVGEPISQMEYGIGVRKKDKKLLAKLNTALRKMVETGEMRSILERWFLWNPMVEKLWSQGGTPKKSDPVMYEKFLRSTGEEKNGTKKIIQYLNFLPLLGKGALVTLEVSILSMLLAIALGLLVALIRLYASKIFSTAALVYVEIWRGTPLLIQLYLIFYGLPHLGVKLSSFVASVLGLGLNYAACEAENYRAGILSVPKTQMDASLALGMSRCQALRHIIIPQALRMVIPPITNDFIALLKDSSLISVITLTELTGTYSQLASTYFDYLGIGLVVATLYFLIGLPFVHLSRRIEQHLALEQIRRN